MVPSYQKILVYQERQTYKQLITLQFSDSMQAGRAWRRQSQPGVKEILRKLQQIFELSLGECVKNVFEHERMKEKSKKKKKKKAKG